MSVKLPGLKITARGVYYRWKHKGRDRYDRLPPLDSGDFDIAYAAAVAAKLAAFEAAKPRRPPKSPMLRALQSPRVRLFNVRTASIGRADRAIPSWLLALAREARKRCARRGTLYTLSRDDLSLLRRRADDRCEVTDIPFDHDRVEGSLYRPFAPSLDRISSAGGYTFGNVRLVAVIVNAALNQWGDEAFWRMVFAAAERAKGVQKPADAEKRGTRSEADLEKSI